MTRVAIQGERGAFSHGAAIDVFGAEVDIVACRSFDELFEAVREGRAERGAVPVENTLAGTVQRPMDLLLGYELYVVAETHVPVELCLIAPPGRRERDLCVVASHPVALEQCRSFFEARPALRAQVAYDTAGSVRDLMRGEADYDAAIASRLAAEMYGAEVLHERIEDHRHNYTRFLIVSPQPGAAPSGAAKTSLAFTVPHRPGSLHRALGLFSDREVDLTRLESRPIPGRPWEYRFYVDLRGGGVERHRACVEALRAEGSEVRVFGHYEERVFAEPTR